MCVRRTSEVGFNADGQRRHWGAVPFRLRLFCSSVVEILLTFSSVSEGAQGFEDGLARPAVRMTSMRRFAPETGAPEGRFSLDHCPGLGAESAADSSPSGGMSSRIGPTVSAMASRADR